MRFPNAAKKTLSLKKLLLSAAFVFIFVSPTLAQSGGALPFSVSKTFAVIQTETWEFHTSISNDGSKVAFAQYNQENSELSLGIWEKKTGKSSIILTYNRGGDMAATWSPDDSRLAFDFRDENDVSQIYIVTLATLEVTRFTSGGNNCFRPDWSPDGQKIVYVSQGALLAKSLEGEEKILYRSNGWISNPAWSPDGSKILFTRGESPVSLMLINADDSNLRELFSVASEGEIWPNWSPCGKYFVYNNLKEGEVSDLVIHEVATGRERELTSGEDCRFPDWSPDGKTLFYSKESNLWQMTFKTKIKISAQVLKDLLKITYAFLFTIETQAYSLISGDFVYNYSRI